MTTAFNSVNVDPAAMRVGLQAVNAIQHASRTGEWERFLALVSDDVVFFTPTPAFYGLIRGKAEMVRLTEQHLGETRTEATLRRTLANGNEVGFEMRVEGQLAGRLYANQLWWGFVIDDGLITRCRWYAAGTGFPDISVGREAFDRPLVDRGGLPSGAHDAMRIEPTRANERAFADRVVARITAGAVSGDWGDLLDLVHDDFSMYVPVPGLDGYLKGREHAAALFGHHEGETRTVLTQERVLSNGNEIAYEIRAEGTISGQTYSNQLLFLVVVEDGKWLQFREYAARHGGWPDLAEARDAFDYEPGSSVEVLPSAP